MEYIKVDLDLQQNFKFIRFKTILNISTVAAVGHLTCLWSWAFRYAPDGFFDADLVNIVAQVAQWEGNPSDFIDALMNCGGKGNGFIEKTDDGYLLHEWEEYCGNVYKKRTENAERKRTQRAKNKTSSGSREDIREMSEGRPQDVHGMSALPARAESESEKEIKIKKEAQPSVAPLPQCSDKVKTPSEDVSESQGASEPAELAEQHADFVRFWQAYPRHVDKKRAYAVWKRIRAPDRERVVIAAQNYAAETLRLGTAPEYIRHPKTFLGKDSWEEWVAGPPGNEVFNALEAQKRAIIEKYTDEEGQRDDRAILREFRALERGEYTELGKHEPLAQGV